MRRAILEFVGLQDDGASENEIVDHIIRQFDLYDSTNPYGALIIGQRIRDIAKKLAKENKVQKFVFNLDNEKIDWYLDHDADYPEWMFALEEGTDWEI